jgi:autotransporter strand-loop-strand O-heptosyltransferase
MENPKIFAHGSYVGNTGYNQHTRDFFRELSKHFDIKVRNFTVGNSWTGYSENPHDEEKYFTDVDKKLLYQQILWQDNRQSRGDYPIYPDKSKEWQHDINIVLCETNHYIFYDNYDGPKIAYNVWESTLQPEHFFNKLKEFDELWVPSKWQKDCTVAQGYDPNKIKVVPEGVDTSVFFPNPQVKHKLTSDGRFKFFLAGRWDYRKSTKEIIETFLKTFKKDEPVDLIVSIDNPFSNDGLETTEQRLKHYGLEDERITVLHFPSRIDYIDLLKSSNCFVSCARSEGWNLPLIEAMACGTPSIYSNCSGQLEFAQGKGIPVDILGERPASDSSYNHFNETVGNYYEPDFKNLAEKMRFVVDSYEEVKKKSLKESEQIRKEFSWERVAEIGKKTILDFTKRNKEQISNFKENKNKVVITYLDGPKVEIIGQQKKKYRVEFINKETSKVLYSSEIDNNMWTACSIRYYIPWQIKINGEIYEELSLKGKKVLISMESKSIGDTIAWVPYVLEFKKKHECEVYLSTFHNSFFSENKNYKGIKFINPGDSVPCDALYRLGWFKKNNKWNDTDRNPNQVNTIPLQKTATDILGLEFKELNYGVHFTPKKNPKDKKYIVIVPNATSGCKEWIYEHWVELTKMIKGKGYDVVSLTKYPHFIDGVENIFDEDLETVMNYMYHAEKFIGLGSGLSWLNWAMGKHTYMINGFAREGHEFTNNITRIYNHDTCVFCWNDEVFVFDAGDWDWCPVYKNTTKQHICQKSILPSQVFEKLDL